MSNSGARAAVTASRNDCRSITSNKPGERSSESEMKVGCACWEKGKARASRRQQQHLCCTRKAPRVMEGARAGEEEEGGQPVELHLPTTRTTSTREPRGFPSSRPR